MVDKEEHRKNWKYGISPSQWILFGVATLGATLTLGGTLKAVSDNSDAIEHIIKQQTVDRKQQTEDRIEAKRDRQLMKRELQMDMGEIKGDVKQILKHLLDKK